MPNDKKYYKTVYTIEVLSEEPYEQDDLLVIAYDISDGDCSGEIKRAKEEVLTGKEMAAALIAQNTDPEFFQLDEEGNKIEL